MSLARVNINDLPENAELLGDNEIFHRYWKEILIHPNKKLTWPFIYGIPILSGLCMATNFSMMKYFNRRLKITGREGGFLVGFISTVLPSVITAVSHPLAVTKPLLLHDCLSCTYVNAIGLQVGVSFVYALIVTPIFSFVRASMIGVSRIPGVQSTQERIRLFDLYKKYLRGASSRIYFLFILNTTAATFITSAQLKATLNMNKELEKKKFK